MQVVENIPQGKQCPVCPLQSIPCLLMTWRCEEPGHQQPWYWSSSVRIMCFQHQTGWCCTKQHRTIACDGWHHRSNETGSAFIKPDQRNPWIKDQIKNTLLPTISHLLLPNFVSCGRACPSHMTQNLVTVGAKLWTADRFIVDPWSMDYADPVW